MARMTIAALAALALVGSAAGEARADFESDVVGIAVDGQVVAGIPGGAPWVTDTGVVEIEDSGKFELDVTGLLLLNGTVGPVLEVIASVHCSSGGTEEEAFSEVGRTDSVPLSAAGDAHIEASLALPQQCAAAIVLVRVKVIDAGFVGGPPGVPLDLDDLGIVPPWIAASGL